MSRVLKEQGYFDITIFQTKIQFRLDLVVNEVEFKLHESFPDPIRTIRTADSSGAYRVGESGYAGFIVHIKVRFMNGFCIDLKV